MADTGLEPLGLSEDERRTLENWAKGLALVVRTLEEVPDGATHWSKRELAARMGLSPSSVLPIWHAYGLQPWRTETFKVSRTHC